ncbi:helix-turn-helix transcriptional regulator [Haloferax sp. DFSO52]|uniref:helix-turn-helix transcriptional regulator n=1 Tax=Haloferax sp. DFSO52 TaxID=3388505 RepID=UPI003A8A27B8
MRGTAKEVTRTLNRRALILQSLLDDPKTKRELVDEVGISRSTIDRGVRELENLGLIEYETGNYRLTQVGQFLGRSFLEFYDVVDVTTRVAPFLAWMDPEWFDVDLCSLRDARIFIADADNSFGPWDSHAESVRSTRSYRGLLPSVGREPMEIKYQSILENDAEHEVIVGPDVAALLYSEPLVDVFDEMLATGRVTVSVYPESIPYYLGIFDDDVVQVGSCDHFGLPYALLESTNPDVVEWAERKISSYKDNAVDISVF